MFYSKFRRDEQTSSAGTATPAISSIAILRDCVLMELLDTYKPPVKRMQDTTKVAGSPLLFQYTSWVFPDPSTHILHHSLEPSILLQ